MPHHPRFSWLTTHSYAHRGLFGGPDDVPENSLPGFELAIAGGYGIELDVRLSADGVPVVFHDPKLERMTDTQGTVRALKAADLEKICLKGSKATIPTLASALTLVAGRVPVLIEVKTDFKASAKPVLHAILDGVRSYSGPFAIMSFDPRLPLHLKRQSPDICRGLVVGRHALTGLNQFMGLPWTLWRSSPDFLAADIRRLPHWSTTRWRAADKPLLTWTVKRRSDTALVAGTTDALIFERPAFVGEH